MINHSLEGFKNNKGESEDSLINSGCHDNKPFHANNKIDSVKTCTCEIKSVIKSFKSVDIKDATTETCHQGKTFNENRSEFIDLIKDLDSQKMASFKKLKHNSTLLQEKIDSIINTEGELLKSLNYSFAENSKQRKAIESIAQLNISELRKHIIDNHLLEIDQKLIVLKSTSGEMIQTNNEEIELIQENVPFLISLQKALESEKRELARQITKEKVKLKRNILGASFDDRKYLARIRANKLNSSIQIENFRLNELSQEMESIKTTDHFDNISEQLLKIRLENLRQDYLSIKRTLRIDKTEENFWKKIDKLPVKQFIL